MGWDAVMTRAPSEIGRAIARLSGDPTFAAFAKPDAAILVFDEAAERILWASPAAAGLAEAMSDSASQATSSFRARLADVASELSPGQGMRLERLRFEQARLAPPAVCACSMTTLDSGQRIFLTAIIGSVPKVFSRARPPVEARGESVAEEVQAASPAPVSIPMRKPSKTVRFVWHADAEGRFTQVSPALADTVGPEAGNIVGRTWHELSQSLVEDPQGGVAPLFSHRETLGAREVFWSTQDGGRVPVDLAGMPVFGPDRNLVGFRGFGLIRTDESASNATVGPTAADPGPVDVASAETPSPAEEKLYQPEPEESFYFGSDLLTDDALPASITVEESAEEDVAPEVAKAPVELRLPEATPLRISTENRVRPELPDEGTGNIVRLPPQQRREPEPRRETPVRSGRSSEPPALSSADRSALREIARALGARFDGDPASTEGESSVDSTSLTETDATQHASFSRPDAPPVQIPSPPVNGDRVLDRLPIGVIVHRGERLLFANRLLLDLVDYDDIGQIASDGGIVRLFRGSPTLLRSDEGGAPLALSTRHSESIAVEVRLATVEWDGLPASLMLIRKIPEADTTYRLRGTEADLRQREARVAELESILDTATDGVIVIDETGRILSLNRSAEALFGYDEREVVGDAVDGALRAGKPHRRARLPRGPALLGRGEPPERRPRSPGPGPAGRHSSRSS